MDTTPFTRKDEIIYKRKKEDGRPPTSSKIKPKYKTNLYLDPIKLTSEVSSSQDIL